MSTRPIFEVQGGSGQRIAATLYGTVLEPPWVGSSNGVPVYAPGTYVQVNGVNVNGLFEDVVNVLLAREAEQ